MAKLSDQEKKTMRELFEKYNLHQDDIFTHNHFVIIKRTGIEKIQAQMSIQIDYEEIVAQIDNVVLKATATYLAERGKHRVATEVVTYGEASPKNCKNAYFWATAEKRALSRAVLKCVGLYKFGVFGEDEAVQDE
jgi:hypothetical protein